MPRPGELSRSPFPPPGMPICPIMAASSMGARDWFSPFECRWMPHPWFTEQGFVCAISRASRRIVVAGRPVMRAAHSGVFSTPSGPRPIT